MGDSFPRDPRLPRLAELLVSRRSSGRGVPGSRSRCGPARQGAAHPRGSVDRATLRDSTRARHPRSSRCASQRLRALPRHRGTREVERRPADLKSVLNLRRSGDGEFRSYAGQSGFTAAAQRTSPLDLKSGRGATVDPGKVGVVLNDDPTRLPSGEELKRLGVTGARITLSTNNFRPDNEAVWQTKLDDYKNNNIEVVINRVGNDSCVNAAPARRGPGSPPQRYGCRSNPSPASAGCSTATSLGGPRGPGIRPAPAPCGTGTAHPRRPQ